MIAVLKIVVTLALVVILLQKRVNLGNAMFAGAGLLFLLSSPQLATLEITLKHLLLTPSTWEILLALYLVMCLEFQLRTSGIIDGLMTASRALFRSDKVLLALMPAFLGFLPSLGGAIFSAPLVEAAAKPYQLSPERKTAINYWFRHLWECTNPIIPALLVGSEIMQVPLGTLISHMLWVSAISLAVGWVYFITPLRSKIKIQGASSVAVLTPSAQYKYFWLALGPILGNLLLVVGFDVNPALSMLVVVATMVFVLRQASDSLAAMFKHAFDKKLLWGIIAILFFQYMLRQTGVMNDVAAVLQNSGIPVLAVIGTIGFIAGLLTGASQGYVAIAFPLAAAVATGDVNAAVTAYVAGFAGQMMSPAHLCLLVTVDYFKADFLKSLRAVAAVAACVLLALSLQTIFL